MPGEQLAWNCSHSWSPCLLADFINLQFMHTVLFLIALPLWERPTLRWLVIWEKNLGLELQDMAQLECEYMKLHKGVVANYILVLPQQPNFKNDTSIHIVSSSTHRVPDPQWIKCSRELADSSWSSFEVGVLILSPSKRWGTLKHKGNNLLEPVLSRARIPALPSESQASWPYFRAPVTPTSFPVPPPGPLLTEGNWCIQGNDWVGTRSSKALPHFTASSPHLLRTPLLLAKQETSS